MRKRKLVKLGFFITAFISLMACNKPKVHIKGTQHDYTSGVEFVSDSVFLNNKHYIDSITIAYEGLLE
tara:strand:- start:420 stop:623 length:204 start_codon:yes stop_codon:yes gene_type:complete